MNIVGTVLRRLSHRFHFCVLTSSGKLVFNYHEILPKTASLMHYIQCYMYSYVIKLIKLTLSKIFFLFRFTNRFRGMMKLLRFCFPTRPCLIYDTYSVCFIMEQHIDNVTHAFFYGFSFQGTVFSFKPFCLLSIITELILLDLKYHGDLTDGSQKTYIN